MRYPYSSFSPDPSRSPAPVSVSSTWLSPCLSPTPVTHTHFQPHLPDTYLFKTQAPVFCLPHTSLMLTLCQPHGSPMPAPCMSQLNAYLQPFAIHILLFIFNPSPIYYLDGKLKLHTCPVLNTSIIIIDNISKIKKLMDMLPIRSCTQFFYHWVYFCILVRWSQIW